MNVFSFLWDKCPRMRGLHALSYGKCFFNFERSCRTTFQRAQRHSPTSGVQVSRLSSPSAPSGVAVRSRHSSRCAVALPWFSLHFPRGSTAEHLSCPYLSPIISSEGCFYVLCSFSNCLFAFLLFNFEFIYIVLVSVFYQICGLQILSPGLYVVSLS